MMIKILKILAVLLLLVLLLLYYVFYTSLGTKQGYYMLSYILTAKNNVDIKVKSIDLHDYPQLSAKIIVERKYTFLLKGKYENKIFDMDYTLDSESIQSNNARIHDKVAIRGTLKGSSKNLLIEGEGKVLSGFIRYSGIKKRHGFRDVFIHLQKASSRKIFELLGEKVHVNAEVNATFTLGVINKETRQGHISIDIHDKDYEGIALNIHSDIHIDDSHYTFAVDINTLGAKLQITQGKYHRESKLGEAMYVLDIPDALVVEKLLKFQLNSPIHSQGQIVYDKKVRAKGLVEGFGGLITLEYQDKKIRFDIDTLPLSPLLKKLSIETLFDSNVSGLGAYHLSDRNLSFEGKLSELVFRESSLSKDLYTSLEVNLSKEHFRHNSLKLHTIEGKLYSELHLENTKNHIRLNDTYINSRNDSIKTNIDISLDTYTLKGKIFVKIDRYTKAKDTYIRFDAKVQKHYDLSLNGMINPKWMSMDYSLVSARIPSHICTIEDDINLTGHISGPLKRLQIEGKGFALEGEVEYQAIKTSKQLEDIHISLQNIHALKLSTLLGYPQLPSGKADIRLDFDLLSSVYQKGTIDYRLKDSSYAQLPLALESKIKIDSNKIDFNAHITLDSAKVKLEKGEFNLKSQKLKTFYTLDVTELSTLEPLLSHPYSGEVYAVGTVEHEGNFTIHGLSKTFGGFTEFHYANGRLGIEIANASLERIMKLFPYPLILDALTNARIDYDFASESLDINADLQHAKFLPSTVVNDVYEASNIDLLQETFGLSTLEINYHKDRILANLMLENNSSHFYITDAQIDKSINSVNALFDVKIQAQAFTGKIYGTLDNPQIKLNLQKLIRHEMDKQLDTFVGEKNRKMMDQLPMGTTAKDMASGVGGAFMGVFF
ncbi:MAG: hypothetical protein Q9M36_10360 [Sulfurovum sp.]|nr:hypothetical protein [Sulfurovum sp.]